MFSAQTCTGAMPARPSSQEAAAVAAADIERRWTLKRNCCVMPREFLQGMAATAGLVLAVSLAFSWRGLWLVALFGAMEIALIVGATVCFARHVRDGETVTLLTDGRMIVDICTAGNTTRHVFNRNWARLVRPCDTPDTLWLHYGSVRVRLARHVPPERRRDLEIDLRRSLPWRGPPGTCRAAAAPLTGDQHDRPIEKTA